MKSLFLVALTAMSLSAFSALKDCPGVNNRSEKMISDVNTLRVQNKLEWSDSITIISAIENTQTFEDRVENGCKDFYYLKYVPALATKVLYWFNLN